MPLARSFLTAYWTLVIAILLFALYRLIVSPNTNIFGVEQNVLYGIQQLLSGRPLYGSPAEMPFAITQYTPLYYWICAGLAKLAGKTANDLHALYLIGRTVSVLSYATGALLIAPLARRVFGIEKRTAWALALLALVVSSPYDVTIRGDSLTFAIQIAAALSFGLWLRAIERKERKAGLLIASVLLAAIGVAAKQSGAALLLIFGGTLLLAGYWRGLLQFVVCTAVICGPLAWAATTAWPTFTANVIGGIDNGIDLNNFRIFIASKPLFLLTTLPLAIVSAWVVFKHNLFFRGSLVSRLLTCLVAGEFLFATATALKEGSSIQYYILFNALAPVLIACKGLGDGRRLLSFVATAYLIGMPLIYLFYDLRQTRRIDWLPDEVMYRENAKAVEAWLRDELPKKPEAYFFANLTVDIPVNDRQSINNTLFSRAAVPALDVIQFSTHPLKVVGYDAFDEAMRTGRIGWVIESEPPNEYRFTKNFDALLQAHFEKVRDIGPYRIYEYRR